MSIVVFIWNNVQLHFRVSPTQLLLTQLNGIALFTYVLTGIGRSSRLRSVTLTRMLARLLSAANSNI